MKTCLIHKKTPGKKGRIEIVNDFTWEDLSEPYVTHDDLRFTLYEWDPETKEALNNAIFIDIDDKKLLDLPDLPEQVQEVFGEVKLYWVHTGGGFHVYIPLKYPFMNKERCHYKRSYEKKCKALEKLIKCRCDLGVFDHHKFGRVPKSLNVKRGAYVIYLGETESPEAESIADLLDYERIVKVKKTPPENIRPPSDEVMDRPLYRECGFIRYVHKSKEPVPHALWKKAMCITSGAGDFEMARMISKTATDAEIREFFNKDYLVSCTSVMTLLGDLKDNPCVRCVHNIKNNCPSFITGPYPTPSAVSSYHLQKKIGKGEDAHFEMNPDRIVPIDVYNRWCNDNDGQILWAGDSLLRYTEGIWKMIVGSLKRPLETASKEVANEINTIPHHQIREAKDWTAISTLMKNLRRFDEIKRDKIDDERYIAFKNGVYDVRTGQIGPFKKDYYLLETLEVRHDEEAVCFNWDMFLRYSVPDKDDRLLLQVFFGLTLSNYRVERYQSYLWLYGASLTGKSMIGRVLSKLVGEQRTVNLASTPSKMMNGEGLGFDLTGKSFAYIDDLKLINKKYDARILESVLNPLVGGAGVIIRVMRTDPFTVHSKSTVVISSNDGPEATHTQSGTMRRARTIYFYKIYPKMDFSKEEAIFNEIDGIALWALKGLEYFNRYGMPPRGKNETQDYAQRLDDVQGTLVKFYKRFYTPTNGGIGDKVPYEAFYKHYVKASGSRELTKSSFTRMVYRYLCPLLKRSKDQVIIRSNSTTYLIGIAKKTGKPIHK